MLNVNEKYRYLNDCSKEYITRELEKTFLTKYHDMILLERCYDEIDLLYDRGLLFIIEILYKCQNYGNSTKLKDKYHYYFKGGYNNLLLLYILDLSSINPLPKHYYCPICKEISYKSNKCPKCKDKLKQYGYNLPNELFKHKGSVQVSLLEHIYLSDDLKNNHFELQFTVVLSSENTSSNRFDDKQYLLIPHDDKPNMTFNIDEEGNILLLENKSSFEEYKTIIISPIIIERYNSNPSLSDLLTTKFEKDIANKLNPTTFDDYIKIKSLAHSTNAWKENQDILFEKGIVDIHNLISNREDVLEYLILHDISRDIALKITNFISCGKPIKTLEMWNQYVEVMGRNKCDDYFIEVCSRIQHLTYRGSSISECLSILDDKNYKIVNND